jgi:hypothetical protein
MLRQRIGHPGPGGISQFRHRWRSFAIVGASALIAVPRARLERCAGPSSILEIERTLVPTWPSALKRSSARDAAAVRMEGRQRVLADHRVAGVRLALLAVADVDAQQLVQHVGEAVSLSAEDAPPPGPSARSAPRRPADRSRAYLFARHEYREVRPQARQVEHTAVTRPFRRDEGEGPWRLKRCWVWMMAPSALESSSVTSDRSRSGARSAPRSPR